MKLFKSLLPWILAIVWLGFRYTAYTSFYKGNPESARSLGVSLNLLFIIILLFQVLWGMYKERRQGATGSFLSDLKRVAFQPMKYVLGVGILLTVYYTTLSTELLDKRQADYALIDQSLDTPEKVKQIVAENDQLKGYTKEQIIDAARGRTELFTNPKVVSSASFLVLIFVTLLYSVFAVFLFRSFLKLR